MRDLQELMNVVLSWKYFESKDRATFTFEVDNE